MICSLIAVVIFMALPGKAGAQQAQERIGGVLTSDIRALVEGGGHVFAGMCEDLDQTANAGKWCATVLTQTTNNAEVRFGPMSSSTTLPPVYYAKFARHESGWLITSNTSPFNNGGIEVPSALRTALRVYVEGQGLKYAGLCSEIDASRHAERWCVVVKKLTSSRADVTYGRVNAAQNRSASFLRSGASWALLQPAPEIPSGLRSSIKTLVESAGYSYAGVCEELQGNNSGRWCATIRTLDGSEASVRVGAVGSSETFRANFVKRSGVWRVESHNVPLNLNPALRSAVQSVIQTAGYAFAGFCFEIDAAANAGRWCANVQAVSASQAQFTAGPVSSSDAYWLTLALQGGSWRVVSSTIPLNVPGDLRAAIHAIVQSRGHVYAGLCREIDPAKHFGQYCALIVAMNASQAYVAYGPVLSDQVSTLQLVKVNGNWQLVAPPTATPVPATPTPIPPTQAPQRPSPTTTPATPTPTAEPEAPTPQPTEQPREDVPEGLRAAIKALVEEQGFVYAGLCREIDQVQHLGERCAFVLSLSETRAQVSYGLVLSDEIHTAEFELVDARWQPLGRPEEEASDDANWSAYLAFVLLGLGFVLAGGFALRSLANHR